MPFFWDSVAQVALYIHSDRTTSIWSFCQPSTSLQAVVKAGRIHLCRVAGNTVRSHKVPSRSCETRFLLTSYTQSPFYSSRATFLT